jgi:hypothetical protein
MTTGSWIAICGFRPRFSSFPKFGLKMKMGFVGLAERYIGAGTGRKPLIFNYLLAEVLPFIATMPTKWQVLFGNRRSGQVSTEKKDM